MSRSYRILLFPTYISALELVISLRARNIDISGVDIRADLVKSDIANVFKNHRLTYRWAGADDCSDLGVVFARGGTLDVGEVDIRDGHAALYIPKIYN